MLWLITTLFLMASAAPPQMNDLHLRQFGDFSKEWQLVTVRYRLDSEEMRFVYANPIAIKAIEKKQFPFPEGSVFAKVGFKTGKDPAFNSSIVPSGTRRFQFMVKSAKKYPETDGWGYGLFQSDGQLFEGDVKAQTMACHACHTLVPERDFVFSERIEMSPLALSPTNADQVKGSNVRFAEYQLGDKSTFNSLRPLFKTKKIWILEGEMRKSHFGGTLDEITPLLIHELQVRGSDTVTGFVSLDEQTFKFVAFNAKGKCGPTEDAIRIWERRPDTPEAKNVLKMDICYPRLKDNARNAD